MRRLVSRIWSWFFVMPRIHLIGRVLPAAVSPTLARNPFLIWKNAQASLEGTTELQIAGGNVNAIIELNKFDLQNDLRHVINQAQDAADTVINLLALQTGNGFSVVLDKIIMPDGKIADIHIKAPEFAKQITAFTEKAGFEQILLIALSDRNLSLALRDLTEGLRQSYIGTIGAARAVEGIRNYFIPDGAERDKGWAPMRVALNVTKLYVQSITAMSHGPRHGDWSANQDESEGRKAGERAWILMNRFLEYRKRGDQPLPDSDFPLLDLSQA